MLIITPVPCSKPGQAREARDDVDVPVERALVVVRRGVEHEVVGGVADVRSRAGAARRGSRGRRPRRRAVRCSRGGTSCGARQHEHLVGRAAPERADDERPARRRARRRCPACSSASAMVHSRHGLAEAAEPGLLLGDLAGHERDAEELAVRVLERGAGLPAGVDDRLRVAHRRAPGVVLHAVADRRHGQAGVLVVEVGPAAVVVGAEHEHLVHAAGRRLGEHRAEVLHAQRLVALEGREQVRHDPDEPGAARAVGLERRRGRLLVAGAERALPRRVGLDGELPGDQSPGRAARSAATVTQRPVSGFRRSWLMESLSPGIARFGRYRGRRRHVDGRRRRRTARRPSPRAATRGRARRPPPWRRAAAGSAYRRCHGRSRMPRLGEVDVLPGDGLRRRGRAWLTVSTTSSAVMRRGVDRAAVPPSLASSAGTKASITNRPSGASSVGDAVEAAPLRGPVRG